MSRRCLVGWQCGHRLYWAGSHWRAADICLHGRQYNHAVALLPRQTARRRPAHRQPSSPSRPAGARHLPRFESATQTHVSVGFACRFSFDLAIDYPPRLGRDFGSVGVRFVPAIWICSLRLVLLPAARLGRQLGPPADQSWPAGLALAALVREGWSLCMCVYVCLGRQAGRRGSSGSSSASEEDSTAQLDTEGEYSVHEELQVRAARPWALTTARQRLRLGVSLISPCPAPRRRPVCGCAPVVILSD